MLIPAKTKITSKLKTLFSSFYTFKGTNALTAFTWTFTMQSRGITVHIDHNDHNDHNDHLPTKKTILTCRPVYTEDLVAYMKFRHCAMTRQKRNSEVEREMQLFQNEIPKWIMEIK